MSLYDTLGVKPDATAAAIKKAFRSLAQKHHPDKQGDHETMQVIQKAYDILGSPESRARYDATGETTEPATPKMKAMQALPEILLQLLDTVDADTASPLEAVRQEIQMQLMAGNDALKADARKIKRRETALKRLRLVHGSENLVASILNTDIDRLRSHETHVKGVMAVYEAMQGLLVDYTYEVDLAPKVHKSTYHFLGL